ncbi:MAG: carbamoyl-phosphate synthase large subunit, partial [Pseudomonadota bacterium]
AGARVDLDQVNQAVLHRELDVHQPADVERPGQHFGLAFDLSPRNVGTHIAVKEAVFPFARFPGVDPVLGPEMKSTGEVMGLDKDFATAFAKSQLGAGTKLPQSGLVFVSVKDSDKPLIVPAMRDLAALGFQIIATDGTARVLAEAGLPVTLVNKVAEGRPHIVDRIKDGDVALIFNTTEGLQSLKDSASIRASALYGRVPYFTTAAASIASVAAIAALRLRPLEVTPLQAYHTAPKA